VTTAVIHRSKKERGAKWPHVPKRLFVAFLESEQHPENAKRVVAF
jgi:hypothetical protein